MASRWSTVYWLISIAYFSLGAYAAWYPFLTAAARVYGLPAFAVGVAVPGVAAAGAMFEAPFLAFAVAGIGVAVTGNVALPFALLAGGSLLYTLSRVASGGSGVCCPLRLAAVLTAEYTVTLALSLIGGRLFYQAIVMLQSPPKGVPESMACIWVLLGSTMAGRATVTGLALYTAAKASRLLSGFLAAMITPLPASFNRLRQELVEGISKGLRAGEWYHKLLYDRVLYIALAPLAAPPAAAVAYAVYMLLAGLSGGEPGREEAVVSMAAAAATGWVAYAVTAQAFSQLLQGKAWRRAAIAGAGLLLVLLLYTAYTAGPGQAASTVKAVLTGSQPPEPLAGQVESLVAMLRERVEGLEETLRLLVLLLWG